MRYLLLVLLLYFVYRTSKNLLRAVRQDGARKKLEKDRYPDLDIEEATWEDIE